MPHVEINELVLVLVFFNILSLLFKIQDLICS